jgi:hypothetical protein
MNRVKNLKLFFNKMTRALVIDAINEMLNRSLSGHFVSFIKFIVDS